MLKMPFAISLIAAATFSAGAARAAQPAAAYVAMAGGSDLFELQASKLVISSTANNTIKGFAQEMVSAHTKSTEMVKAAAAQDGLTAGPPKLNAQQKSFMAALMASNGASRDNLYIKQQKFAHKAALQLHQDYAASGDKPALKAAAAEIVPVVQHHIQMLDAM